MCLVPDRRRRVLFDFPLISFTLIDLALIDFPLVSFTLINLTLIDFPLVSFTLINLTLIDLALIPRPAAYRVRIAANAFSAAGWRACQQQDDGGNRYCAGE